MRHALATKRRLLGLAASGLVAVIASPAYGVVSWTVPNGSAGGFDYLGGRSDNGLFGDPLIVGNTFIFFPSNFRAESGGDQNVNDRLQVEILAHADFEITGVAIQELGDYQITGTGEVSVSGTLQLTDLENFEPFPPFPRSRNAALSIVPGSPIAGTDIDGQWQATAARDLSADVPGWEHLMLVLTNEVAAVADAGSVSSIEKTGTAGAVLVTVIPEPATVLLLAVPLAILRARRRR